MYGKGNKRREIGLGDTSRSALRRYITRYRKPSKANLYVFVSDRGGTPLTVGGMEIWLDRIADRAHIEDAYIHKFRHTFAVNYLLNGGDLYRLMRLMGHTDVKITQVYLRAIDQKQARGGMSVLDTMNK